MVGTTVEAGEAVRTGLGLAKRDRKLGRGIALVPGRYSTEL